MVQNLDRDEIGCILFGDDSAVEQGSPVYRTGRVAGIPVGDGFLGRVVDALGSPIDGGAPVEAEGYRPMESPAPEIIDRQPVNQPMETGLIAIDSMFPIGRGQRELIIGDRQTGKTRRRAGRDRQPARQERRVHLRRHRPEGQLGFAAGERASPPRGDGIHDRRQRFRQRSGADAVRRAVRRLRHGRILHGEGARRADRLRRPVQARGGLSRAEPAARPLAGPRGVSGRRVLPALPLARARGAPVGRAGRRQHDRAADRRDASRRRVRLHPDEHHLHHRRPAVSGKRAVLRGPAPGGEHRPVRLPRRRRRAGRRQ